MLTMQKAIVFAASVVVPLSTSVASGQSTSVLEFVSSGYPPANYDSVPAIPQRWRTCQPRIGVIPDTIGLVVGAQRGPILLTTWRQSRGTTLWTELTLRSATVDTVRARLLEVRCSQNDTELLLARGQFRFGVRWLPQGHVERARAGVFQLRAGLLRPLVILRSFGEHGNLDRLTDADTLEVERAVNAYMQAAVAEVRAARNAAFTTSSSSPINDLCFRSFTTHADTLTRALFVRDSASRAATVCPSYRKRSYATVANSAWTLSRTKDQMTDSIAIQVYTAATTPVRLGSIRLDRPLLVVSCKGGELGISVATHVVLDDGNVDVRVDDRPMFQVKVLRTSTYRTVFLGAFGYSDEVTDRQLVDSMRIGSRLRVRIEPYAEPSEIVSFRLTGLTNFCGRLLEAGCDLRETEIVWPRPNN
jgi:hypothetical protein